MKLKDSEKLRKLADWIDLKYPNDAAPEVQNDLRRIADNLEEGQKAREVWKRLKTTKPQKR